MEIQSLSLGLKIHTRCQNAPDAFCLQSNPVHLLYHKKTSSCVRLTRIFSWNHLTPHRNHFPVWEHMSFAAAVPADIHLHVPDGFNDLSCIQISEPGFVLLAAKQSSAYLQIPFLCAAAKNAVMPYSDESSRRNMHQESSDEFNSGKRKLLPLAFIAVILDGENDFAVFDPLDAVIADSDAVSILSEVIDNCLSAVECSFAVRLPFF